jgi:hypothetical protein
MRLAGDQGNESIIIKCNLIIKAVSAYQYNQHR